MFIAPLTQSIIHLKLSQRFCFYSSLLPYFNTAHSDSKTTSYKPALLHSYRLQYISELNLYSLCLTKKLQSPYTRSDHQKHFVLLSTFIFPTMTFYGTNGDKLFYCHANTLRHKRDCKERSPGRDRDQNIVAYRLLMLM